MSVAISGVKGYEYQYKVTVWIALLSDNSKTSLYVEQEGKEDALLVIKENESSISIEVQVKRERGLIEMKKVVDWLSHFQERKSNNNLLQRLIERKTNIVLFVTHSRCSDATVNLRTSFFTIDKHKGISLSKKEFTEFKEALKNKKFGDTSLMRKREDFCSVQADNFKSRGDVLSVLERCLILEEFSDEKVDNQIKILLNEKYNIAQSRVDAVYRELLDIVREGRDTGKDIHKKIMDNIQSNKIGAPIIDSHYMPRDEEQNLITHLENDSVLLLTGVSQCGKTELGKIVAKHFVDKGFDYQIHDDILELKRYLNSNISDDKVGILEDPFGHLSLKDNYFDILRKLRELLSNKERHHLIVVTSRVEVLYEAFSTKKNGSLTILAQLGGSD